MKHDLLIWCQFDSQICTNSELMVLNLNLTLFFLDFSKHLTSCRAFRLFQVRFHPKSII